MAPAYDGQDHALQVVERQQRLVAVVTVDRLRIAGEVLDRGGHVQCLRAGPRPAALDVRGAHGAASAGSSAQVSYVRPHLLSRDRSCTGAKSHFQPVALQRLRGRGTPGLSRAGSQVAPMPIDCGYSGACHGCPKPCTASTPKIKRDVQPRVLDRVLLDHVVLVGPVEAGVADPARCQWCRSGCWCPRPAPSRSWRR